MADSPCFIALDQLAEDVAMKIVLYSYIGAQVIRFNLGASKTAPHSGAAPRAKLTSLL